MKPLIFVATLLLLGLNHSLSAQGPPAYDSSLGVVDFPVSCGHDVQGMFTHGVILLHHMTYPEAKKTFEAVAARDPDCAMAYWGVAVSLFQPLWPTRPGPADRTEGWEAVRKAETRGAPTERERFFIAAADSFFRDPESDDYWARIRRWADASELTFRKYPEDDEAAAFYALSLLATSPADGVSLDHQDRAAELLLLIHAKNPLHPGSLHYLIHANDVRGREHESLDLVQGYDDIAPENPHALHMPTHIYTRLGDWKGVVEGNLRAASAALKHPAGNRGEYVWDEFPHALEYLVYAYLQLGADSSAAAQIERLRLTEHLHPTFKTAFHASSIPARYALERKAWIEAAALTPRPLEGLDWDRFLWPEAITWFARGLGAAELDQVGDAKLALARIQELEHAADSAGEALFVRQIRVLRLGVTAWTSQALDRPTEALERMRAAVELEMSTPKHPVTPAPTLPAQELLGELFLKQERPDSALVAFERSLALYPKRFNSLLGAARAARALGESDRAVAYYAALLEQSSARSTRDGLSEAGIFLEDLPGRAPR